MLTALLTSGTVLLFALVFYLVLQDDLLNEIDDQLRDRAALVTHALQADGDVTDDASLPPPPALVEFTTPGLYVELMAPDGRLQAVSANVPNGRLPGDATLLAAARAGHSTTGTVTAGEDEQLRVLMTPIPSSGRPVAILVVAESLEPLQRALRQARTLLEIFGVLVLVLAIGGAALLTGQALGPIARLTNAAANVAMTGQYHERVPLPSRSDEVGQLATTFNELIATVQRTLDQQRQFLADTSHELRSPLTVVLANLDLLRRDPDQPERELSIEEATAEAQRMRRLVNDLLLLAQSDAAQAIARAPVRLEVVVEETTAVAARQAPDYHIHVDVEGPLVVIGDRERLTQLLRNLLENAVVHTVSGTDIHVRLWHTGAYAHLTVSDNGPGIDPEHLPHIWERFYRVDKARSRALGGTGLGLAIAKYIAEAHGGSATATSRWGQGSQFSVMLPLDTQAPLHEQELRVRAELA
jgi:heavy metal sensor kinase